MAAAGRITFVHDNGGSKNVVLLEEEQNTPAERYSTCTNHYLPINSTKSSIIMPDGDKGNNNSTRNSSSIGNSFESFPYPSHNNVETPPPPDLNSANKCDGVYAHHDQNGIQDYFNAHYPQLQGMHIYDLSSSSSDEANSTSNLRRRSYYDEIDTTTRTYDDLLPLQNQESSVDEDDKYFDKYDDQDDASSKYKRQYLNHKGDSDINSAQVPLFDHGNRPQLDVCTAASDANEKTRRDSSTSNSSSAIAIAIISSEGEYDALVIDDGMKDGSNATMKSHLLEHDVNEEILIMEQHKEQQEIFKTIVESKSVDLILFSSCDESDSNSTNFSHQDGISSKSYCCYSDNKDNNMYLAYSASLAKLLNSSNDLAEYLNYSQGAGTSFIKEDINSYVQTETDEINNLVETFERSAPTTTLTAASKQSVSHRCVQNEEPSTYDIMSAALTVDKNANFLQPEDQLEDMMTESKEHMHPLVLYCKDDDYKIIDDCWIVTAALEDTSIVKDDRLVVEDIINHTSIYSQSLAPSTINDKQNLPTNQDNVDLPNSIFWPHSTDNDDSDQCPDKTLNDKCSVSMVLAEALLVSSHNKSEVENMSCGDSLVVDKSEKVAPTTDQDRDIIVGAADDRKDKSKCSGINAEDLLQCSLSTFNDRPPTDPISSSCSLQKDQGSLTTSLPNILSVVVCNNEHMAPTQDQDSSSELLVLPKHGENDVSQDDDSINRCCDDGDHPTLLLGKDFGDQDVIGCSQESPVVEDSMSLAQHDYCEQPEESVSDDHLTENTAIQNYKLSAEESLDHDYAVEQKISSGDVESLLKIRNNSIKLTKEPSAAENEEYFTISSASSTKIESSSHLEQVSSSTSYNHQQMKKCESLISRNDSYESSGVASQITSHPNSVFSGKKQSDELLVVLRRKYHGKKVDPPEGPPNESMLEAKIFTHGSVSEEQDVFTSDRLEMLDNNSLSSVVVKREKNVSYRPAQNHFLPVGADVRADEQSIQHKKEYVTDMVKPQLRSRPSTGNMSIESFSSRPQQTRKSLSLEERSHSMINLRSLESNVSSPRFVVHSVQSKLHHLASKKRAIERKRKLLKLKQKLQESADMMAARDDEDQYLPLKTGTDNICEGFDQSRLEKESNLFSNKSQGRKYSSRDSRGSHRFKDFSSERDVLTISRQKLRLHRESLQHGLDTTSLRLAGGGSSRSLVNGQHNYPSNRRTMLTSMRHHANMNGSMTSPLPIRRYPSASMNLLSIPTNRIVTSITSSNLYATPPERQEAQRCRTKIHLRNLERQLGQHRSSRLMFQNSMERELPERNYRRSCNEWE
eukprot:CAMPEP_0176481792 /NCGR_PEP_ID=MMETSP0200_2-20121128/3024_1 /TAXON_ID=947934 /ORGANISM="Chaetoceros sp., Strain GSL56" /LENGTH=1307 /DNA_ID=CAMNT_0017878051 /DNA_START=106 /DNA_END=4029 /DNA_ORIENTATION=-